MEAQEELNGLLLGGDDRSARLVRVALRTRLTDTDGSRPAGRQDLVAADVDPLDWGYFVVNEISESEGRNLPFKSSFGTTGGATPRLSRWCAPKPDSPRGCRSGRACWMRCHRTSRPDAPANFMQQMCLLHPARDTLRGAVPSHPSVAEDQARRPDRREARRTDQTRTLGNELDSGHLQLTASDCRSLEARWVRAA